MKSDIGNELAALTFQLADMCALAGEAMNHATNALLRADIEVAQAVIAEQEHAGALSSSAEEKALELLSLHPSMAADLREIVNAIRITADAREMGELAVRVAEIARRHHPRHAVPPEVSGRMAEMSAVAVALACTAQEVLLSREPRLAAHLRSDDGAAEDLHRQLLAILIDPRWRHGVATGLDVALLSGLYKRFADHAIRITKRFATQTNGHRHPRLSMDLFPQPQPESRQTWSGLR
jgi:phosphate transport system protein